MSGFTPLSEKAFHALIEQIPRQLRLNARSLLLEILFRTRRHAGWYDGVRLQRGQLVYGEQRLGAKCYLSYQQTRTLMLCFKKVGFLTVKVTGRGSIGTVVEYDTYVRDHLKSNAQNNGQLTDVQRTANDIPKVKGKRNKEVLPEMPLPDPVEEPWKCAAQSMNAFLDRPAGDLPAPATKWLGRMKKEKQLSMIAATCKQLYDKNWSVQEMSDMPPGKEISRMIAYISKVSKENVIEPTRTANVSEAYHITDAHGKPVTDRIRRLERILSEERSSDPDPGHPWSIPDADIVQV
jgi:hypothetical protein